MMRPHACGPMPRPHSGKNGARRHCGSRERCKSLRPRRSGCSAAIRRADRVMRSEVPGSSRARDRVCEASA